MSAPTCTMCGQVSDQLTDGDTPLGWTVETDTAGRSSTICPTCTREHVRAIEAKLDRAWW